jgi:hypothetical protein
MDKDINPIGALVNHPTDIFWEPRGSDIVTQVDTHHRRETVARIDFDVRPPASPVNFVICPGFLGKPIHWSASL